MMSVENWNKEVFRILSAIIRFLLRMKTQLQSIMSRFASSTRCLLKTVCQADLCSNIFSMRTFLPCKNSIVTICLPFIWHDHIYFYALPTTSASHMLPCQRHRYSHRLQHPTAIFSAIFIFQFILYAALWILSHAFPLWFPRRCGVSRAAAAFACLSHSGAFPRSFRC